jgi:hypothetical protein
MERTYRFEIFKKNLQEIETFNLSHPDIKLDLNDFGLLTRREFKKTMTNPDFLFLDDTGLKHHVNVNDPRNEEVIAKHTVESNLQTLKAIKRQIAREGGGNALTMLEWDLEEATQKVDKELNQIHDFLETHHHIQDDTELLDQDGGTLFLDFEVFKWVVMCNLSANFIKVQLTVSPYPCRHCPRNKPTLAPPLIFAPLSQPSFPTKPNPFFCTSTFKRNYTIFQQFFAQRPS